jgi:hypothetical protein
VDPENEEEINSDDEEEIDQGEIPSSRQTLPQCLYPTPINKKKTIKTPDIVMIMNLRAQTILTNRFRPPKAGSNKIHIIEVSYTNLASYQYRYNKKFYKYQDTITKLKDLGSWEPILHIIIIGSLGEIPRQLAVTLTEIGIKSTALEKLQK